LGLRGCRFFGGMDLADPHDMSTLTLSTVRQNLNKFDYTGLGLPALVLLIMAMLVVPLPALLLDVMFTFNIACSLVTVSYTHLRAHETG
jgi:flagellar biosynthesis component FlhA